MRPRTARSRNALNKIVFPKTTQLDVPPPSQYDNTEELGKNLTGKYHLSNHRNSKAAYYHKGKRFNNSCKYSDTKSLMLQVLETTNLKMISRTPENTSFLEIKVQEKEPLWMEGDNLLLISNKRTSILLDQEVTEFLQILVTMIAKRKDSNV